MMKGFFKFYREGGKVNKNVLRTDRDNLRRDKFQNWGGVMPF
jgi:hypothetical protein